VTDDEKIAAIQKFNMIARLTLAYTGTGTIFRGGIGIQCSQCDAKLLSNPVVGALVGDFHWCEPRQAALRKKLDEIGALPASAFDALDAPALAALFSEVTFTNRLAELTELHAHLASHRL
jgi:hypothetical protein